MKKDIRCPVCGKKFGVFKKVIEEVIIEKYCLRCKYLRFKAKKLDLLAVLF
ncbi:MAG: hypothetical protein GY864_05360 [Desulfobacterales bacterium]|nr:hypothetical protein [Desulfobacterales bacterium]